MIDEMAVLVEDGKLVGLAVPSSSVRAEQDAQSRESAVRAALSSCAEKIPRYMQLAGFALIDEPLPRTELGKLRRHLLPVLYRAARTRPQGRTQEPAELPLIDRALLKDPIAQRIWSWLKARFPDRSLSLDMSPQLDLGIDSLGWIALTMELERALGVTLNEGALERVSTLRDLIEVAIAAKPEPAVSTLASTWLAQPDIFARTAYFTGHMINRILIRRSFPLNVEGIEHLPELGATRFYPGLVPGRLAYNGRGTATVPPGDRGIDASAPVPVVPVYIEGTFAAWPTQRRFPRRHRLTVRFGPPLHPQQWPTAPERERTEESIAVAIKAEVGALRR